MKKAPMIQSVSVHKVSTPVSGALSFSGDKSLSHRAIMFGALAEGKSSFTNVLSGEDCVCTRKAFEAMGVTIEAESPETLTVWGKGLGGLRASATALDCGNSGTSMRLLSGILAGQSFESTLTGDPSLSSRPMRRVTDYLKQMGAVIEGRDNANYAPLKIKGQRLSPIDAKLTVSSAQVKSAILLAGLYAKGCTSVTEPVLSRDHTENFMEYFGVKIKREGLRVSVEGGQKLEARSFPIAGDVSSAAFFMAMAVLLPGASIEFKSVLNNPSRTGIFEVLKRMGVVFGNWNDGKMAGPEKVVDFSLNAQKLKAFEIKKEELPSLIDEVPILMVLATQAEGVSVIHDADELRVKESDRIETMTTGLRKMGADIRVEKNTIYINPNGKKTLLRGTEVDSFKDHRVAMSLVVAGMIAKGESGVKDTHCINTSFPTFFDLLSRLGIVYKVDTIK